MGIKFSIADCERLQKEGKIVSFTTISRRNDTQAGRIVAKHFKKKSKEKEWISKNLFFWCQQKALLLWQEFRFDETGTRNFCFDWAIPELKIGIEYEGIFCDKSGHTTISGYTKDVVKYNLATAQGWRLIRLTAVDYTTLIDQLNSYYATRTD